MINIFYLRPMEQKHIGNLIAWITGIFGYTISITNVHFAFAVLSQAVSLAMAFLAPFMGFLGKKTAEYISRFFATRRRLKRMKARQNKK